MKPIQRVYRFLRRTEMAWTADEIVDAVKIQPNHVQIVLRSLHGSGRVGRAKDYKPKASGRGAVPYLYWANPDKLEGSR